MKLKSKKKHRKKANIVAISSIVYGIIFIITDIFHYFYSINAEKELQGILHIIYIPYETFAIKIYNIAIHMILVIAGIAFLKRKPIAWYLYNFFFIGWILKFPGLVFLDSYCYVNWIEVTGLSYLISIVGLIYFNINKVKNLINHTKINKVLLLSTYIFCIFLILSLISYNNGDTPRDSLQHILNEAIVKNKYSKYKNHFQNILDTVSVNWNNVHELSIIIVNENNKPIYKEELAIGESDLLCFPYKYDHQGNLLREFTSMPFYNAIVYKYDSLNRRIRKELCSNSEIVTFLPNYDTITNENNCLLFFTYKHSGDKIVETGYRPKNDPFLKYELHQNNLGQIISRMVIEGYPEEGNTYYFYNKSGNIQRIEEYMANDKLNTIKYFYYQKNELIKSEEYYFGENSFREKLFNLVKLKSYTSKYITYYFNENEITQY